MLKKLRGLWGGTDTVAPENLFPIESESFYQNPYPFYERLRREHPFYRSDDGMWVLSTYEDNVDALRHKELGNSPSRFSTLHQSKRDRFVCADVANNIMPFLDGPSHEHHRKIMGLK
jgi:cytochrome P450